MLMTVPPTIPRCCSADRGALSRGPAQTELPTPAPGDRFSRSLTGSTTILATATPHLTHRKLFFNSQQGPECWKSQRAMFSASGTLRRHGRPLDARPPRAGAALFTAAGGFLSLFWAMLAITLGTARVTMVIATLEVVAGAFGAASSANTGGLARPTSKLGGGPTPAESAFRPICKLDFSRSREVHFGAHRGVSAVRDSGGSPIGYDTFASPASFCCRGPSTRLDRASVEPSFSVVRVGACCRCLSGRQCERGQPAA